MSFDVVRHYVTFRVMSFGIMSHSALCCIWPYVLRLCVIQRNVALPNVVWRNVVWPTVGVSFFLLCPMFYTCIAGISLQNQNYLQNHLRISFQKSRETALLRSGLGSSCMGKFYFNLLKEFNIVRTVSPQFKIQKNYFEHFFLLLPLALN